MVFLRTHSRVSGLPSWHGGLQDPLTHSRTANPYEKPVMAPFLLLLECCMDFKSAPSSPKQLDEVYVPLQPMHVYT